MAARLSVHSEHHPSPEIPLFFHRRFIPGLAIATYVVGDEKAGVAAVIDPVRDIEPYLELARKEGLRITHVFETHVHADFVSGSVEFKDRLGDDVRIIVSGMGGNDWTPPYADVVAGENEEFDLGTIRFRALHTPGHTPEHVSWALFDTTRSSETPWLVFTGDFIFVGDVGRPDLLGAEAQKKLAHQLYESLFERISGVPDFTEIFPAHGAGSLCGKALGSRPSSTFGYERHFNSSMQRKPEEQWTGSLLAGMPPAPPYFKRMKQVNAKGPELLRDRLAGAGLSAKVLQDRLVDPQTLILDVRSKEAFAAGHIPGSQNIPLAPTLATWAGWLAPYEKHLVLLADTPANASEAALQLARIGVDDVVGHLDGGIDAWETAGLGLAHTETLDVGTLESRLKGET